MIKIRSLALKKKKERRKMIKKISILAHKERKKERKKEKKERKKRKKERKEERKKERKKKEGK